MIWVGDDGPKTTMTLRYKLRTAGSWPGPGCPRDWKASPGGKR
jgi:hypothetical protein